MRKILIINGPNLNLTGTRKTDIYGTKTLVEIVDEIKEKGAEMGFSCDHFQSNHEGAIVDTIQTALGVYDGIVINPAAYTHTSVAILDALKAVSIPAVEVHISDVDSREAFRQISYPGLYCEKTIKGQGIDGYRQAIVYLKEKYA